LLTRRGSRRSGRTCGPPARNRGNRPARSNSSPPRTTMPSAAGGLAEFTQPAAEEPDGTPITGLASELQAIITEAAENAPRSLQPAHLPHHRATSPVRHPGPPVRPRLGTRRPAPAAGSDRIPPPRRLPVRHVAVDRQI